MESVNSGYTPEMSISGVLRMQGLAPFKYNLRIPTCDYILFQVSAGQAKFFQAKNRPENAVEMIGTEVGELFRFTYTI